MRRFRVCLGVLLLVLCVLSGCSKQDKTDMTVPTECLVPTESTPLDQNGVVDFRDPNKDTVLNEDDAKILYEKFIANEITAFDETNVPKYFLDYLLRDVDVQDYIYTYLDMTGDGLSELCVKQYPEMYFFTVKNDQIHHWYTEHNSYSKLLDNGALLFERHGGAPTHINYIYYELDENAKVKLEVPFSWWDGGTIETGKVYPDTYIFDDKEVTKEEYEGKTKVYLSIGSDKLVWYDMKHSTDNDPYLLDVLNDKTPFINEKGELFYLKDYKPIYKYPEDTTYYEKDSVFIPCDYAFVDLDQDGQNELVISESPYADTYLILHKSNEEVYGYSLYNRWFQSLKTDGNFLSSGGAVSHSYKTISFNKNSYTISTFATLDFAADTEKPSSNRYGFEPNYNKSVFEIDEKQVSFEEIEEFAEEWNKRPEPDWIKFK